MTPHAPLALQARFSIDGILLRRLRLGVRTPDRAQPPSIAPGSAGEARAGVDPGRRALRVEARAPGPSLDMAARLRLPEDGVLLSCAPARLPRAAARPPPRRPCTDFGSRAAP
jgi:hypothetical protein